jgi:hypothetical protein
MAKASEPAQGHGLTDRTKTLLGVSAMTKARPGERQRLMSYHLRARSCVNGMKTHGVHPAISAWIYEAGRRDKTSLATGAATTASC